LSKLAPMTQASAPAGTVRSLVNRISTIGQQPSDSRVVLTRKTTLALTTIIGAIIVIPWGVFYVAIGLVATGMIPLIYAILSAFGILHLHRTRDDRFLRYEQTVLFLVLPLLVHLTLGGFVNSSGVVMYSIVGVLGGVSFANAKRGGTWFAVYATFIAVLVVLDPAVRTWAPDLSETFIAVLLAVNILTVSLLVYLLTLVYVRAQSRLAADLAAERERSEQLLLNVLPASIAARLKDGEQPIADRYDEVGVLFADIVDFTPLSEQLSADSLVEGLNGLFSIFDELAVKHGVEKVKTIGDSYMAISGAPEGTANMPALASLALDMRTAAASVSIGDRVGIDMRFGMDAGPAIAGVIGESKFIYDVYGDTVNMASRMESHGEPNKIQITARAARLLEDEFDVVERGVTEIKGKGRARTFFLDRHQA